MVWAESSSPPCSPAVFGQGDSKAAGGHKGGALCPREAARCSQAVGSEVAERPLPGSPC